MGINFLFVILLTSALASIGTLSIAQDPSKTLQTTAGFATYYSDSYYSCPNLPDLMTSTGMYFSINGIVATPTTPGFVDNYCGQCIAIKTKSGRVMSPVRLIDSCANGCYFSDPGHLNILSNNNNALYKAIEEGADRHQGAPMFTWWWLPSCEAPLESGSSARRSPVPASAPTGCPDPTMCLSKWGWCGTTDDYCGDGCQAGPCKSGSIAVPVPKSPTPVPVPRSSIPVPSPRSPTPVPVPRSRGPTPVPAPQSPIPVPSPRSPTPVPAPVSAPSTGNTGCSDWQIGTISGYDNLDGADDMHPGCLAEYCGTNDNFLNNVPVVSILQRDFNTYKYHNIEINWNGKIGTVQVWDECANADCPGGGQCCTDNAKAFGGDFLLDVDRHPLKNLFGVTSYDSVLDKVQFRICQYVDPGPMASKWLVGGREEAPSSGDTGVPGYAWGLIGAGIGLAVLGLIILVALVVYRRRRSSERV